MHRMHMYAHMYTHTHAHTHIGLYLVTRNQAACVKSGDTRVYVLMWGMASVRPLPSLPHFLNNKP